MGKTKDKSGPLARRPDNSAFKQQRLPAWSPMLTANTVLPFFYLLAVISMLLGVWLLLLVQSTQEIKVSINNPWFLVLTLMCRREISANLCGWRRRRDGKLRALSNKRGVTKIHRSQVKVKV